MSRLDTTTMTLGSIPTTALWTVMVPLLKYQVKINLVAGENSKTSSNWSDI